MYRVYLRHSNQAVSEPFETNDPEEARAEFTRLINKTEYDGLKIGVALTRNGRNAAFHRFDAPAGTTKNWRCRTDEIELTNPPGRPNRGVLRKNISIAPELWDEAIEIGGGNASAGIAIAIKSFKLNRGSK